VHLEDAWCAIKAQSSTNREPVSEVVRHVVSAERQHCERVAAQFSDGTFGSGRALGRDVRSEEHTVRPVGCFNDKWNVGGTTTTKQDRVDGHTLWRVPVFRDLWALRSGNREARVWVRCRVAGLRRPWVALPVDELCW